MVIYSKFRLNVLIVLIFVLLFSFSIPAFAKSAQPAQGKEVYFSADYPLDFDEVIVITAVSKATGFWYTHSLCAESNYESYFFLPYGEYSLSAKVSSADGEALSDGVSYIATASHNAIIVKSSDSIPSVSFLIECYTYTDGDASLTQENSNDDSSPVILDNTTINPEQTPNSNYQNSTNSDNKKNSDLIASLLFSIVAILVFFVCGYIYRKHKEG